MSQHAHMLKVRKALFEERVERLLKLLKLNSPEPILTMAIMLIVDSGFTLYPDMMQREFGRFVGEKVLQSKNICLSCTKAMTVAGNSLCLECITKFQLEERNSGGGDSGEEA